MAGCVRKHKPAIRPRLRPDAIMLDPQALSTLHGLWASQLMTLSPGQARATAQDML